jgi:hypothetical protein
MPSQTLVVANTASHDGYGATAIGLQSNTTVMDSGLVGSWQCWIWAMFQTTAEIQQGSSISVATWRIMGARDDSDTTWAMDVHVEKVANATAPTNFTNLSGKTLTTAKTSLLNDAITQNVYKDIDIASALQELVDAHTIASGSYILVVGKYAASTVDRRFYQRDNGTSTDPELNIDYSDPPAGGTSKSLTLLGVG